MQRTCTRALLTYLQSYKLAIYIYIYSLSWTSARDDLLPNNFLFIILIFLLFVGFNVQIVQLLIWQRYGTAQVYIGQHRTVISSINAIDPTIYDQSLFCPPCFLVSLISFVTHGKKEKSKKGSDHNDFFNQFNFSRFNLVQLIFYMILIHLQICRLY